MLDIKFIRENPEKIRKAALNKRVKIEIDKLLELDKRRRELLQKIETFRSEQNKLSKQKPDSKTIQKLKDLKIEIKNLQETLEKTERVYQSLILKIPNPPLDDVPVGKNESENVVLREVGKKPKFDFKPKDYLEIGQNLDLIDTKRAAKVSGTRFGYLKNEAVLLEFALINLAFEFLTKKGFSPIIPPVIIKPEMMKAMGYVDTKEDLQEIYLLERDDLFLVATAEQSIGPMHAGEVFQEKELPQRYVGFSTCFRREAGSYGKDTKGILRVHQFDKVEMFSFCRPEESIKEHQFFLSLEEELMQKLEIPYRVVQMCTGDLGRPAAAKYDIEAWLPGENQYRETHSTSSCTDFQARRLNIRFRYRQQKLEFVHTLNGTAFALGRTLIAIIENYQQKDGSVKIPKVLQKYCGIEKIY